MNGNQERRQDEAQRQQMMGIFFDHLPNLWLQKKKGRRKLSTLVMFGACKKAITQKEDSLVTSSFVEKRSCEDASKMGNITE